MKDTRKTKNQLINELVNLRKRTAELEKLRKGGDRPGKTADDERRFSEVIIQHSAVATFVIDSEHNVVLWNKACEELTGISASDVVGTKRHWKAFYGRKRPTLADIVLDKTFDDWLDRYAAHGKSTLLPEGIYAERWFPNLGGKSRYIIFDAAPIHDDIGDLIAVAETIQDITDRKRAEDNLLKSQQRFMTVLDSLDAVVYVADMETYELLFVNEYSKTLFGDVEGKLCWQALQAGQNGPCDFCTNRYLLDAAGNPRGVYAWEFQNTVTGKWYGIRDRAITWVDGRVVRLEIATDITDRKNADVELKQSKEKERLILNSAAEAIYGVDRDGNFTFCNSSFLRLLGYQKKEEVLGKNAHALIHHSKADGTEYPIEECKGHEVFNRDKGVHIDDEVFWRADGSSFYVEYRSYPMYREDEAIGAVISFTDITERKKAEAKMTLLTDELKRSNQELEQFAAVASHDLQSPLLAVMSALKLLRRGSADKLDEEATGYIDNAMERASNMIGLIRDLLKYSRVGAGSDKFKTVSFEDILKEATSNLKVNIEDTGAVITHDRLPAVMGKSTLLIQLLQNLIDNSIKFCEKKPRIHVSAIKRGNEWVLSVRDNGIGISSEYATRVFEIFSRLHEKGIYAGSGIGLATCKKVVELHGGRIWVTSERGKGSIFYFTLPSVGS